ncbi:MAG: hypothetical protein WBZ33_11240, partial [Thermoactinomyces sp.]
NWRGDDIDIRNVFDFYFLLIAGFLFCLSLWAISVSTREKTLLNITLLCYNEIEGGTCDGARFDLQKGIA